MVTWGDREVVSGCCWGLSWVVTGAVNDVGGGLFSFCGICAVVPDAGAGGSFSWTCLLRICAVRETDVGCGICWIFTGVGLSLSLRGSFREVFEVVADVVNSLGLTLACFRGIGGMLIVIDVNPVTDAVPGAG